MKKIFFISVLIATGFFTSCSNQPQVQIGKDVAIADMVQTIPTTNIQKDSAWNIWCGSMVKGYDGKYHLFNSRWPRGTGHEGWISHSQIAYSVAEKPEGPYTFVNIPLPQIDNSAIWDGSTTHNPYMVLHDGKYFLYYVGTKGTLVPDNQTVNTKDWWERRNSQRIGVAIADKPEGPWKRFDTPIFSANEDTTAFDAMLVTNPAICIGRDNKVVMLYKAVCKNGTMTGGHVRFSVAFADSPTGPFVRSKKMIFQPKDPNANMVAEDPYIWFDKKTDMYYAIVRDVVNQFTGEDSGQLALLQSKDALEWVNADKPKVLPRYLKWDDGSVYDAQKNHVERPFLSFDENGLPNYLFGAFSIHKDGVFRNHSFNGRIPLRMIEK